MQVRVLFFASLRDKVKTREANEVLDEGSSIGDLWAVLCGKHVSIEPMGGSVSFAVNREYASRETVLHEDDEVALIPPVSGGR